MATTVNDPRSSPRLSICIATYNRSRFIGETLDSILMQLPLGVELLVVDGASPDNTHELMEGYARRHPELRYFREDENSGVDRDYDKAVAYARGEFCWLMTDDDLLRPDAISLVLDALDDSTDLVIVNSEMRDPNLDKVLNKNVLKASCDRTYAKSQQQEFFSEVAAGLSFIGGVVVRRSLWMNRARAPYYGSLFVHVGVIFQGPIDKLIRVIRRPLIVIRCGNSMWSPRGFEIWMFKWPGLVWSFPNFSDAAKERVCLKEPWRNVASLVLYRGCGGYGLSEYREFIAPKATGMVRLLCWSMAVFPGVLINAMASVYCFLARRRMGLFEMSRGRYSNWVSRLLMRWI